MVTKYRKLPVEIEAIQWDGSAESTQEIVMFCPFISYHRIPVSTPRWNTEYDEALFIPTLEGPMKASVKDYIIKGIQGEFYPCKPDIFEATYEEV